jgi:hypothetical protein
MTTDPFNPGSDAAEAAAFLSTSGYAAKWPKVGFTVAGTITGFEMRQQTDYDTGEPLTWKDGKPRMQLLVHLQCEPTGETWEGLANTRVEIEDDDGARTAYVKGNLQKAFGRAIKEAKARLEIGAYVEITRGKDGPKPDPKKQAPHTFTVKYTPAAQNPKAVDALLSDSDPFADVA